MRPSELRVCACEGNQRTEAIREQPQPRKPDDRQNRDIGCKCAAHVTIPPILSICVAARGDGTTARRVVPGRNGLVPDRRAPKSGTAARVTTLFGSYPKPAASTRARTTRTGSTHQTARPVRDALRPEPGTARQRSRFCFATTFGTRRVRFFAQQEQITSAVHEPILRVPAVTRPVRPHGCRVPRNAIFSQSAGREVRLPPWTCRGARSPRDDSSASRYCWRESGCSSSGD